MKFLTPVTAFALILGVVVAIAADAYKEEYPTRSETSVSVQQACANP